MLDYLQALALFALIVAHYYLVRGCFSIREAIPATGGTITTRLDKTTELLDELAQLIADLGDATSQSAPSQTPNGLPGLLSMFLNNRMNMGPEHAQTLEEWSVHPPSNDSPPTKFQGNELDQHR